MARMRPGSDRASLRMRNSWSSRVKMSLVTTAAEGREGQLCRKAREGEEREEDVPMLCVSRK